MKAKISYICSECGYDTPKFMGKCPECGSWNSLREFKVQTSKFKDQSSGITQADNKPLNLNEIVYSKISRIQTEYNELNTVLGGGIVPGSVTLIAGDPGVGKSTMLLQLAMMLSKIPPSFPLTKGGAAIKTPPDLPLSGEEMVHGSLSGEESRELKAKSLKLKADNGSYTKEDRALALKVLYVSGEESAEQIKMRAERIKLIAKSEKIKADVRQQTSYIKDRFAQAYGGDSPSQEVNVLEKIIKNNLMVLTTSDPDEAIEQAISLKPQLLIVDSIQTMQSKNLEGLSGSVGQVRYSAMQFIRLAKENNIPVILVGHVTKEGMVAGPMVLSHMVDTVLFLEGDKNSSVRILRSFKNRFGPVDEVGIFQMGEDGIKEVVNPEQVFLTDGKISAPGSVLLVTLEGTRPFLVELQALAVYTKFPMPKRVVSGIDLRRVELLLAVLQKHIRLPVDTYDIYINIAGGLKISDPGADLAVCLAVFSSIKNIDTAGTVGIAEVGLLGELRKPRNMERRVKEAEKMGYRKIIVPGVYTDIRQVMEKIQQ